MSATSVKIDHVSGLHQCMSAELKLKVLQERMAGRKDAGSDLKRREGEYLSLVHIGVSISICGFVFFVKYTMCNIMC